MFVVVLKFSSNKEQAGQFMAGHKEWIQRGFDDGMFVLVGSLQPAGAAGSWRIAPRYLSFETG